MPIVVGGYGVAPLKQALIVDGEISAQVPDLQKNSVEAQGKYLMLCVE